MIYERRHTRMIADFGGLAKVIPAFSALFLIVTMSSIGLPGTNGFVGEFLILAGTFQQGISSSMEGGQTVESSQVLLACGLYAFLVVALFMIPYGFYKKGQRQIAGVLTGFVGLLSLSGLWVVYPQLLNGLNTLRTWHFFLMAVGVLAGLGIILGAVYMLSMYRRVIFGPLTHSKNEDLQDLTCREWCVLSPLIILIFVIGLFPNIFLDKMSTTVDSYVTTYLPELTEARDPASSTKVLQREKSRKVSATTPVDTKPSFAQPAVAEPADSNVAWMETNSVPQSDRRLRQ